MPRRKHPGVVEAMRACRLALRVGEDRVTLHVMTAGTRGIEES